MGVKARVQGSPEWARSYRRERYGLSITSASFLRNRLDTTPVCASTMSLHDWATVTYDGVTIVMCGDCGRFPSEIAAAWEI